MRKGVNILSTEMFEISQETLNTGNNLNVQMQTVFKIFLAILFLKHNFSFV
jgi:hypothetical protein